MNNNDTRPLMVSIRCITYNHEPYIRQCLEGFVMQKTNFRFEAIVHDDASTDGTAAIVREYAEKYPDIIKPILETENQYSKHDGSLNRIMMESCTGKYIALCEGDDYWIEPLKLQKQVDFLESHPDYSMCFHNARLKNETNSDFKLIEVEDREYQMNELFDRWIVPTASMMIRNEIMQQLPLDARIINGDINIVMNACAHGRVYGMSCEMSVYRVQEKGLTIKRYKDDKIGLFTNYIGHYQALGEHYPVSKYLVRAKLSDTYAVLGNCLLNYNIRLGLMCLLKAILVNPVQFSKKLFRFIKKKI